MYCDFGSFHQADGVVGVIRKQCDADRHLAHEFGRLLRPGRGGEHLAHARDQCIDVGCLPDAVGQDREAVAADPRNMVFRRQRMPQCDRHRHQQFVAELVPERIVDELEIVEVKNQQRQHARLRARQLHRRRQVFVQPQPVVQQRQRIGQRHRLHLLLARLQFGDVAQRERNAGIDAHSAVEIPGGMAVARAGQFVLGFAVARGRAQQFAQQAGFLVGEQLGEHAPDRRVTRHAHQPRALRIAILDAEFAGMDIGRAGGEHENGVAHAVDRMAVARFGLLYLLARALASDRGERVRPGQQRHQQRRERAAAVIQPFGRHQRRRDVLFRERNESDQRIAFQPAPADEMTAIVVELVGRIEARAMFAGQIGPPEVMLVDAISPAARAVGQHRSVSQPDRGKVVQAQAAVIAERVHVVRQHGDRDHAAKAAVGLVHAPGQADDGLPVECGNALFALVDAQRARRRVAVETEELRL